MWWMRSNLMKRAAGLALFFLREADRGSGRLLIVTLTEHNRSARKRGELRRDRGSRRISQAVAARRRLEDRRVDRTRTTASRSTRAIPATRI